MPTTRGCSSLDFARTAATWHQPPGAAPRSMTRHAGLQDMVAVVDLDQLVGGARAIAVGLRALHIGIVDVALQPAARRFLQAALLLDRASSARGCRRRACPASWSSPRSAAPAAAPHAFLAHQFAQDAFAQAAVGDPQPLARPDARGSLRGWRSRRAPDRRGRRRCRDWRPAPGNPSDSSFSTMASTLALSIHSPSTRRRS